MTALEEIAELRKQLATFHSAVEHVTEDGCTRRSVVAMPEGWAMVHKDRLHDLELAEEQLAATDGYIMCEKDPVAWEYFHSRADPPLSVGFDDPDCVKSFPLDIVWKVPLYRAP